MYVYIVIYFNTRDKCPPLFDAGILWKLSTKVKDKQFELKTLNHILAEP